MYLCIKYRNMIHEVEKEILKNIEDKHGVNYKLKVENLHIDKKRLAMFASICDKKDAGLKNMIKELETSNTIIYQLDKIIERIRKYNPVGDIEKKSFGEIFTPFSLINEMLDTLPTEVWSNPNLKWGDFCNGVGNFMVVIVRRLMIGLEKEMPDENKRYKHIIEKMIYVAELQVKNMFLWMVSIDPKSKLQLNLYRGSSLSPEFDEHMREVWKVEKFDIMVSNPPYQELKEGFKKSQSIWQLFVEKYISILSEGGYMTMVHPSGWRNVDGIYKKIQNLLKSKEVLYLKMHSFKEGFDTFGAKINFDYYCVKNKLNNGYLTTIICEDNEKYLIDISKVEFIPSENINDVYSLVAKNNEQKVNIVYSRTIYGNDKTHMSKIKTKDNIYPCVYTVKSNNEPTFHWSSLNNGHFGIPKIIWGNGASGICIDKNGEYGIMNFACAISDDIENFENIKKALQSEKFIKKIMMFKNSLGDKYNRKIISTFRKDFWKEFI